jgi:glycosyltransferase involved in cell wall biosynthesis
MWYLTVYSVKIFTRKLLVITSGKLTVGVIGRINQQKGQENLLKTFLKLGTDEYHYKVFRTW